MAYLWVVGMIWLWWFIFVMGWFDLVQWLIEIQFNDWFSNDTMIQFVLWIKLKFSIQFGIENNVRYGSCMKTWWKVTYRFWCFELGGSSMKYYKTWSTRGAKGWNLWWCSQSFLPVVAGKYVHGGRYSLPLRSSKRDQGVVAPF